MLYCNEACRDASWETYHYVECRYMDLLHSVCFLFLFFFNKKMGGEQQIFSFFLHHVTMLVYGSCMQSGLLFIEWCIPLRFLYEES